MVWLSSRTITPTKINKAFEIKASVIPFMGLDNPLKKKAMVEVQQRNDG